MSKKGENIYKRKDNRWEARYSKGRNSNGKIIYGYCYGKSYKDVKEKLREALKSYEKAEPVTKENFVEFCDEWLNVVQSRVKESTYIKYVGIVNKHLKPEFGNMPARCITTPAVSDFTNKCLNEKTLSAKTVRDILTILNSILKYARKRTNNSFTDIDIVFPRENRHEVRVLNPEEQEKFVDFLCRDMDECRFGILLALMTGLRIGEICALKWKDVSLTDRTIYITHTMQRLKDLECGGTHIVVSDTKTSASERKIPLTDQAVKLCKKFYNSNPEAYLLTGSRNYIEPRALQYRLKAYTAKCELEGVHFHVLRHTFATRCVESGFEIKSLSEVLGHSNPRITLERYVHPSMELKRINMDKIFFQGV